MIGPICDLGNMNTFYTNSPVSAANYSVYSTL